MRKSDQMDYIFAIEVWDENRTFIMNFIAIPTMILSRERYVINCILFVPT